MNRLLESYLKRQWLKHKSFFLQQFAVEQAHKLNFADLRLWLTDLDGNRYYQFDEDKPLPVERYGELMGFMQYLLKGFDPGEETMILEEMEKSLANGLKDVKMISRIGFLIGEMKERKKLVIHSELLYNIVAVTCIRHDELPDKFSPEIQKQKVLAFKKYVDQVGAYPFFQNSKLKKLNHYLSMSEEDFKTFFKESQIKQEALKRMLKRFHSKEGLPREDVASGTTS